MVTDFIEQEIEDYKILLPFYCSVRGIIFPAENIVEMNNGELEFKFDR